MLPEENESLDIRITKSGTGYIISIQNSGLIGSDGINLSYVNEKELQDILGTLALAWLD